MVDFFLKGFTYFIFIFIDSYVYLRIFLREKLFYKPLIELSNFRKYFVTINNEDHSVWEIGNKDAVKEKTLILIGGIPTDPLKSMSWMADCLNTIDNSLRIIIFNMPYYEDHFNIDVSNSLAISNGESLTSKKIIDFSKLKVDPKYSHVNQSKTIKLLMNEMGIDAAHLVGHDRGAVILENLCMVSPDKVLSYSRGSQVWNHYEPQWRKLAPKVLVGPPHSIMSSYHQLRLLLFAVIFLNRPIQLLSQGFVSKARKAKKGTHLFDRYTHLKLTSQVAYKSYFNKFKQSLMQGGLSFEVENRNKFKDINIPIMQFQGEDEFKEAPNGVLISDQPYFGKYNLYKNEIEDIYPGAIHQSSGIACQSQFITDKNSYKMIQTKVGSKFSRFCLIPESAHFNVIENPKSCANAVYDFIISLR